MNKAKARRQLPRIGEHRMETPTIDSTYGYHCTKTPQRCVVVDVRPVHLWYTVQFENGIRESYKVPRLPQDPGGGIR